MATLIDSYSESNQSSSSVLHIDSQIALGQSFSNINSAALNSCKFYVKKRGLPTGNAYAKVYTHSGTFGSSSIPTGEPLATSDALSVSILTTTLQLKTFTFSGEERIVLSANTYYVLVISYSDADSDSANYLEVGSDSSSPSHAGSPSYTDDEISWSSGGIYWDYCFYVYGTTEFEASVSPINITLSLPSVTATYLGVGDASVSPVVITLSIPSVTPTWVYQVTASVSPVSITLATPSVTATYVQAEIATVSSLPIQLTLSEATATYLGVWNASVAPVEIASSLSAVTAIHIEIYSAVVASVGIASSLSNVTATYLGVWDGLVAPLSLSFQFPAVIAKSYQPWISDSINSNDWTNKTKRSTSWTDKSVGGTDWTDDTHNSTGWD